MVDQAFHLFGKCVIDPKLFAITLCLCFAGILQGCSRVDTLQNIETTQWNMPKQMQVSPTVPEPSSDVQTTTRDEMRMVFIPKDVFQMGSTEIEIEAAIDLCHQHYHICNQWFYEREGPLHTVSLGNYLIDQTEVSNAQYWLCVDAGVCEKPIDCNKGDPTYSDPAKATHPVVCVNWEDARNYCQWVGGRLPTEGEWEYAFRGKNRSVYPWGDEFDGNRLNYCDQECEQNHADNAFTDGYAKTAPTGSFPGGGSWSGVFDMSGNVFEWVSDWFGEYTAETISNPTGPIQGGEKIIRGCSWFSHPSYCRGASRHAVDPDTRLDYLGFRCANDSVLAFAPADRLQEGGNEPDFVVVPMSSPPILDGTISSGEWDLASVDTFADGNEIRLMQAGEFLYLGLRAKESGTIAGNVFIKQDDQIRILHSSAALGTAKFIKEDMHWQKVQDFSWRCRSTGNSQSDRDERVDFLLEENWLAANGRMGTPNELEYQIKIPNQSFKMAVVYIKAYPPYEKIAWPDMLEDDCIEPSQGGLPEEMRFSPEQWIMFDLIDPDFVETTEPTSNP
jgi:formylglycine-generating enzyme required for sulfatase activity